MARYHRCALISCEVPWDDREQLIEPVFREQVRRGIASGFKDLYIFGTAGEGYAVDTPRFDRVARVFREETSIEGVNAGCGVIGLSTANIIERLRIAHGIGFRFFQISLPSWGALNDAEVMRFFRDVCGAFPDSRFLHYNLMRTKRLLTVDDYVRIVAEVPNLAATKNTGTTVDSTAALVRRTPELQHFFGEAMFPLGCLNGECSLLSSWAPMVPWAALRLFELGVGGRVEELFHFHRDYLEMTRAVIAPMLRHTLMDGAYDKAIVRLGGLEEMPLRLLSPYETVSEETYQECRRILHQEFADWLASNPRNTVRSGGWA
ncbi:MAG: dihydrodipicolinate synthase family protein [Acidobacteria bacterium]|nr:dihydrodipicolinate synthase family protein [Acidobacteriota bacterium]